MAGFASGGGEGSEGGGGGGDGDGRTAGRMGVEGVEVGGGGGEAVVDEVGAAALVDDLGVGAVGGEGAGDGVGAGGGTDEGGDFARMPSEAGFFAAWEDDEAAADGEGEGFAGGDAGGVLGFESEAMGAVDEGGLAGEDAFGREGPGGGLGVERETAFGEGPEKRSGAAFGGESELIGGAGGGGEEVVRSGDFEGGLDAEGQCCGGVLADSVGDLEGDFLIEAGGGGVAGEET